MDIWDCLLALFLKSGMVVWCWLISPLVFVPCSLLVLLCFVEKVSIFSLEILILSFFRSRLWNPSIDWYIMDLQEFKDAIRTIFAISQIMERKLHEQYDRIMDILGEHEEKNYEIKMDWYKIKCSSRYESDTYTTNMVASR